jgi:membrane associated rhomboid family serine protease
VVGSSPDRTGSVGAAVLPVRDLNPTQRLTPVTWLLIGAAIAVFWFVQPHDAIGSSEFFYEHATIPCEITTGDPVTIDEVTSGRCSDGADHELVPGKRIYLSLVVSIFLHGSVLHLLGNVWILWIFGNNVEDEFGSVRFAVFYLSAGLIASIGHVALRTGDTTPVVGASGAIAGVMGAYLVLHPWARVVSVVPPLFFLPFRVPAAVFLVVWFALQFALAGQDTNIAWEAHVVGFVAGLIIAAALRASGRVTPR